MAVYTTSDVQAAPVTVSMSHDELASRKRAIVVNSGIANAYTGRQGITDAAQTCVALGELLNLPQEEIYIASTGKIGERINMPELLDCLPKLVEIRDSHSSDDFCEAILTTDTCTKFGSRSININGLTGTISAYGKGSGMIMPDMATMICCVVTDIAVAHATLKHALLTATEQSFNRITVDGDMSTNDCVFLLSNGLVDNPTSNEDSIEYEKFYEALESLLIDMAQSIVRDGEGATKFITVEVKGTDTEQNAKLIAMSIANSPLVKTAFFSEDLNWGRLLMAVGKAKSGLKCDAISLYINGLILSEYGDDVEQKNYDAASLMLKEKDVSLTLDFHQGNAVCTVWTCDFSHGYIEINSAYRT